MTFFNVIFKYPVHHRCWFLRFMFPFITLKLQDWCRQWWIVCRSTEITWSVVCSLNITVYAIIHPIIWFTCLIYKFMLMTTNIIYWYLPHDWHVGNPSLPWVGICRSSKVDKSTWDLLISRISRNKSTSRAYPGTFVVEHSSECRISRRRLMKTLMINRKWVDVDLSSCWWVSRR